MDEYCVYILRCGDGSYYTGVTSDWKQRLYRHQIGYFPTCYTYERRPVVLVYLAEFGDVYEAIAFEKQVKRWSRRKKKALIQRCFDDLRNYAECQNNTHCKFIGEKPLDSARGDKKKE